LLRRTLEAPCSTERVWQRILASQGLGPSAVESAPAAFRLSSRGLFWGAAVAAVLAVAVGVGLYLAGGHGRGPLPGRYPGPVVRGPLTVVDGGTVRRGAEVTTAGLPARLILGNYCRLEIAPYSRLRLVGDDRDEAVSLQAGQVTCDVDRGVGGFEVRTDAGTVTVHGTKFSAAVEDVSHPMDLLQGVERMFTRKLAVTVFTGMVVVSGTWGDSALVAGQSREFVKGAPATQPGVTRRPTDFEIAYQKYHRAQFDRTGLPVALARVMLPEQQQAQAQKILEESAAEWAKYQDACRGEVEQNEKKATDLSSKAAQDPTVLAAWKDHSVVSGRLSGVKPHEMTAEQKQALQESAQRVQKTMEATADYGAAQQVRVKSWENLIKGMNVAPTLQKLETVLTAEQMATLNKRMEQIRELDANTTEAGRKWGEIYPGYVDVATAITDMGLEKDVAEKALAEVKAAEGRYREYLDSQREQLERLSPEDESQKETQRLWAAAAKLRAAGRDVPGTIKTVGAVLSPEQVAELGQRVTRMEQARAGRSTAP
jgi:hypothetical protein